MVKNERGLAVARKIGVCKKEGPAESSMILPTRRKNRCPSISRDSPGGGGVSIEQHHAEAILRFDKDLVKIIEKPATKHPLTDAESLC
jgi:hypothetical protein